MNTLMTSIELPAGRAVTLPTGSGHALRVTEGRIWLTQSGDPDDHFIDAGERVPLGDGRGSVVIEAVGGAARCRMEVAQLATGNAQPLAA